MWLNDKASDKSLIHVCKGKTLADMGKKNIEIRKHEEDIFSWIYEDGDCHQERISYCPYCGADLEKEEKSKMAQKIVYPVYSEAHDITTIFVDWMEGNILLSTEVVGFYYGFPDRQATKDFEGKMKATFEGVQQ